MTSISIVMPLFNKSAYVGEAVAGFLRQLGNDDEIIVVDDVSSDDGPILVESLASVEGERRLRLLRHDRNRGPAAARNTGAAAAKAKYLLFFDADDVPQPQLLSVLRSGIATYPEESVFAYDIAVQAHGESGSIGSLTRDQRVLAEVLSPNAFVRSCLVGKPLCTASSTCVRASAFQAVDGFSSDLRYCEDSELWTRLSARHSVVHLMNTLAVYRDVSASLSYTQRVLPGAVQPFVETLFALSQHDGDDYQRLGRDFIVRNIVFSLMFGASRDSIRAYLQMVSTLVSRRQLWTLRLLLCAPRKLLRVAYRVRAARLRHRAA